MNVRFRSVPNVRIESGSSLMLAEELKALNVNRPFIVTDQGVYKAGLLDGPLASLSEHEIECTLYTEVVADPPESVVLDSVELAKNSGCDSVIGFGGGSSMDVAKLIAVLVQGKQELASCYGVDQVKVARVPLIQVPTTAGTGSEATAVAIVTTGETTKAGVVSPVLFADTIVLDAQLTIGLPAHITAATGIDAMVHAVEAFTSIRLKNPLSDMLAIKALDLLAANIKRAVHHGDDVKVRSDMLLGAMLAGQAFANAPVGAVHALAYPLGGVFHIPHGLSNSLVLPHVLRFNGCEADDMYTSLLPSLGLKRSKGCAASHIMADYFYSLAEDLGLQTQLRQMGIQSDDLTMLASEAMYQERLLINNPRKVSERQALEIYQQAY